MARLGREAVEVKALLPQWVACVFHLRPWFGNVAYRALIPTHLIFGDAVIIGTHKAAAGDDDVGQVRRRLWSFPVRDHVFAVFNRFRNVAVGSQPAAVGEEWFRIMHLLPEGNAWIGTKEHQRRAGFAVFAGHDVIVGVAPCRHRHVQQALDVHFRPPFQHKFPIIAEPLVVQFVANGGCQFT